MLPVLFQLRIQITYVGAFSSLDGYMLACVRGHGLVKKKKKRHAFGLGGGIAQRENIIFLFWRNRFIVALSYIPR